MMAHDAGGITVHIGARVAATGRRLRFQRHGRSFYKKAGKRRNIV